MNLPKELTTVTRVSKAVALLMFILLPIVAFLFGMKYQKSLQTPETISPPPGQTGCTLEARICPDGSNVGRSGPNCEFTPCPTLDSNTFICPKTEQVDCEPGPDINTKQCSKEYLTWAQANCPNFKGAAY